MSLTTETQFDDNQQPITSGYDPTTHGVAAVQLGPAVQDPVTLRWYAPVLISLSSGNSTAISDGVTPSLKATVGPFHNADNQSLAGIANALVSAGVAQILNPAGTADRQRGTGFDGIGAAGTATGTQQLRGPLLSTTVSGTIVGNASAAQTVTCASTANMVATPAADLLKLVDAGGAVEYCEVISIVDATHFTAIIKNSHTGPSTLSWYHYNQAADASIGDNVSLTGMSPSQTYLYNAITGNAELERSANGEYDLASTGMNVAAPYLFLSGAPGGYNYMRERGIVGLVQGGAASNISSGGVTGSTSITLASAPTGLQPGTPVELTGGTGVPEWVWTAKNYTAGANPVVLDSGTPIAGNNRTTMLYPIFGAQGPGLNDYPLMGEAAELQAVWNDATKRPRLIQSATANGAPYGNSPLEAVGLDNGATLDKMAGNRDTITLINASNVSTTQTSTDQTNINGRGVKIYLNVTTIGTGSLVLKIQAKDPVSGQVIALLTSAAVAANGFTVYTVYPGITATANVSASDVLPRTWNVTVAGANGTSFTVSAAVIL